MLPLYEAKMIHHFDHRFGTYEGQTEAQANVGTLPRLPPEQQHDPRFVVMPRYWVQEFDTLDKQKSKPGKPVYDHGVRSKLQAKHWEHYWLLGWRDTGRSTDERTVICSLLPRVAVSNKLPLALTAENAGLLTSIWSSYVFDYVARQKVAGATLNYFLVKQFPVLPPNSFHQAAPWDASSSLASWIILRVLELTYTAWDLEAFAQDIGDDRPPFQWDEERRTSIRTELDAAYFHLYGLERDEVEHVMDSFDALRRREEKPQTFGEFRTKRLILERYDAMVKAIRTGESYQTILDPPPGHGPRHLKRDVLRRDDLG